MTKQARPLAKALHTVTVVARVASYLRERHPADSTDYLIKQALEILGYSTDDVNGPLYAACVAAVAKGA